MTKVIRNFHSFFKSIVNQRIVEYENNKQNYGLDRFIFLDKLIDEYYNNNLPRSGIMEECLTFVWAGEETTSAAIYNTLFLLAAYPETQQKIFEELMENRITEEVCFEDINKLSYLDAVMRESLRYYPSVGQFARRLTDNLEINDDVTLPSGMMVLIQVTDIHRNRDYWGQDADEYKPERFLSKENHAYSWIPFSAGRRNCIGQKLAVLEIKMAMIKMVQTFQMSIEDNVRELEFERNITLDVLKRPNFVLKRRNSQKYI